MSTTAPKTTNPILTLQERVADLLAADDYFRGYPIYTEQIANIEQQIEEAISQLGFFIMVTTSSGTVTGREGDSFKTLRMEETLTVAISSNPTLDEETHPTALDAVPEVIRILHGKPNNPAASQVLNQNAGTYLRVVGHEFVPEAPAGLSVQHVTLETTINFLS